MAEMNLERRIKKHLWAREHEFVALCSPGLEPLCADELTALGLKPEIEPGGVKFMGRWEDMQRANLQLATASRVLLRLKSFRYRRWDDLTRQVLNQPWEYFLKPGAPVKIMARVDDSGVRDSSRVERESLWCMQERFNNQGIAPPKAAEAHDEAAQRIIIRAKGMRVSISLDTSGVHLHKRGYRQVTGKAPLREDLAAALVRLCGLDGISWVWDAMCGAGTLGIEATMQAMGIAPGLARSFGLEDWPSHREPAWNHLKKQVADLRKPSELRFISSDKIHGAIRAAKDNIARAGLSEVIQCERQDIFEAVPPEGDGLILINPPYGKRIIDQDEAHKLHRKLGDCLQENHRGKIGLVLFEPEWIKYFGIKREKRIYVPHGGLKVVLISGHIEG